MTDNSGTTAGVTWGKINSTYANTTDMNIPQQVQQSELNKIYYTYRKTKDKLNSGRKRSRCKRCGNIYFADEGIIGGFCKLDCKYSDCIMEEENDGKDTEETN